MLSVKFPLPVKFVCGLIYADEEIYAKAKKVLEAAFCQIDFESSPSDFNLTHYYDKEMGIPLYRRFLSFTKLYDPSSFVAIKLRCIKIEKKFLLTGRRQVNIDPGYLNEAKFVLTTTKDYSHRIYLGKGVYAEITLHYQNGMFCDLPTTYPDYRTPEYKDVLATIREQYRHQILHECKR
ncbi:MAG: DUF4416 family protein [Candidatus Omnitrophota bacterium]